MLVACSYFKKLEKKNFKSIDDKYSVLKRKNIDWVPHETTIL